MRVVVGIVADDAAELPTVWDWNFNFSNLGLSIVEFDFFGGAETECSSFLIEDDM